MAQTLALATQSKSNATYEVERDLARAKGQLLAVIGTSQVAAVANSDFRDQVRDLLLEGKLTPALFEQLENTLDDHLEALSAAAEQFLDEELRAVLP